MEALEIARGTSRVHGRDRLVAGSDRPVRPFKVSKQKLGQRQQPQTLLQRQHNQTTLEWCAS